MSAPENDRPYDLFSQTDAIGSILVVIDGPGDKTIRPARPDIPREYPRPNLKPRPQPGDDTPKEG
jgi:hypothetical protein